jgi:hypothetical protein
MKKADQEQGGKSDFNQVFGIEFHFSNWLSIQNGFGDFNLGFKYFNDKVL